MNDDSIVCGFGIILLIVVCFVSGMGVENYLSKRSTTVLDFAHLRYYVCLRNTAHDKDLDAKGKMDKAVKCNNMYNPIIEYLEEDRDRRENEKASN